MNPRQRLQAVLNHEPTDRLCVDLGAGGQTGIGVCALHRLRQQVLGEQDHPIRVCETFQMLGEVDDALREALQLDVVGVATPGTFFGVAPENWKPFTMPDGTPCLVPGEFNTTVDAKGDIYVYPEGDTTVPPCAVMPAGGFFFDALDRQREDFDEDNMNPQDNTEDFGLLSDANVAWYKEQVMQIYNETEYGIYITLGGAGFGDIACVPAPWLKAPKGLRNQEEWYMATVTHPDFMHKVFETQCEISIKNLDRLTAALGDMVQAIFISGTDFGTQRSLFCSVDSYKELYQPYHKAVNRHVHENSPWKTFIHSCGAIHDLIPELIESGFDILNPVQCSADGMDPATLKREFGKEIVFWGGGIDTQKTLPFGTPDEIYREARERIEIFHADATGFVFNSIHNIQSNVPTENILAMFRAVNDARGIEGPTG